MNELKTYKFNFLGDDYNLAPFIKHYENNDRLAILLYDVDNDEEFDYITVNLPDETATSNEAYVNVEFGNIENFIADNKLGFRSYKIGYSGNVMYPRYTFDLTKLNKYE